jgi:LEA14-like dessication related protein
MKNNHPLPADRKYRFRCLQGFVILTTCMGSGCASMRPTVEGVSARVVGIDFEGVELAFDVAVRNNAFIGIRTPSGRYAVRIADKDVVGSDVVPAAELPAGGVGTITLPAQIRYLSLWKLVGEHRTSSELPYEMEGALVFDIAGQRLPVEFAHQGTLPVLKLPKIAVTGFDTSGFSLRGTDVTVSATLTNPNIFALGVSKLGYELTLGNIEIGRVEVNTPGRIEPGESSTLTARCKLTASSAASSVLKGGDLGAPKLKAIGAIETPYGSVNLPGN